MGSLREKERCTQEKYVILQRNSRRKTRHRSSEISKSVGAGGMRGGGVLSWAPWWKLFTNHYLAQGKPRLGQETKRSSKWWNRQLKGRTIHPGSQISCQAPKRQALNVPKALDRRVRPVPESAIWMVGVGGSFTEQAVLGGCVKVTAEGGRRAETGVCETRGTQICCTWGHFVQKQLWPQRWPKAAALNLFGSKTLYILQNYGVP